MYYCFIFAGKPDLILALSGLFLLGYLIVFFLDRKFKSVRSLPLLLVSIAWLLVAIWELYLLELGYDIRIDVLVIYPLLFTVTVVCFSVSIASMVVSLFKRGCRN